MAKGAACAVHAQGLRRFDTNALLSLKAHFLDRTVLLAVSSFAVSARFSLRRAGFLRPCSLPIAPCTPRCRALYSMKNRLYPARFCFLAHSYLHSNHLVCVGLRHWNADRRFRGNWPRVALTQRFNWSFCKDARIRHTRRRIELLFHLFAHFKFVFHLILVLLAYSARI